MVWECYNSFKEDNEKGQLYEVCTDCKKAVCDTSENHLKVGGKIMNIDAINSAKNEVSNRISKEVKDTNEIFSSILETLPSYYDKHVEKCKKCINSIPDATIDDDIAKQIKGMYQSINSDKSKVYFTLEAEDFFASLSIVKAPTQRANEKPVYQPTLFRPLLNIGFVDKSFNFYCEEYFHYKNPINYERFNQLVNEYSNNKTTMFLIIGLGRYSSNDNLLRVPSRKAYKDIRGYNVYTQDKYVYVVPYEEFLIEIAKERLVKYGLEILEISNNRSGKRVLFTCKNPVYKLGD